MSDKLLDLPFAGEAELDGNSCFTDTGWQDELCDQIERLGGVVPTEWRSTEAQGKRAILATASLSSAVVTTARPQPMSSRPEVLPVTSAPTIRARDIITALFGAIDSDGSGTVEEPEGRKFLLATGCAEEQTEYYWNDLVRTADCNGECAEREREKGWARGGRSSGAYNRIVPLAILRPALR